MNEKEWLECTDPTLLLASLEGKVSDRKLWLFACACCRRIWHLLPDVRSKEAIEVAEKYADGEASDEQLCDAAYAAESAAEAALGTSPAVPDAAHAASFAAATDDYTDPAYVASHEAPHSAATAIANFTAHDPAEHAWAAAKNTESVEQCRLLRDIFGNLFRPVTIKPTWLTLNDGPVCKIAQSIYDERAFDQLPILADALLDAGFANADILAHCRGPGPHVCGCWLVDAVLGKE